MTSCPPLRMSRRPYPASLPLDFDGWPRIERQDLTDWLAELADVAGLEAVRFLVTRFGDEQLSVPKTYREHKLPLWLEETRDLHSASLVKTIIRLFGGANVHMPSPVPLHQAVEDREIRRLYDGRNAGDLARRYRRSRRHVKAIALARA